MKKVLMLSICFMLLVSVECFAGEKRIKKISKNNVVVESIAYMDKEGKEPVVIHAESYGEDRLNEALERVNGYLQSYGDMDCVEFKANKIMKYEAELAELLNIKSEMEK